MTEEERLPLGDDLVHLGGEVGDFLAEFLGQLRQLCILMHELDELGGLTGRECQLFGILPGQLFAMLGVGLRVDLVAVRLAGLRQENQWRGIGGLKTEGEIQENEGVEIEVAKSGNIKTDPGSYDDGLRDEEDRRAKKAGKGFRLQREPVIAKN